MVTERTGDLERAIDEIKRLKGFPVSLWAPLHFDRYNEAFSVFWSFKPPREVFCDVMAFAPITPEIMWLMTQGDNEHPA